MGCSATWRPRAATCGGFAHGQLYVAASRTGSPSELHFATTESGALQDSLARNVVYREVLLQKHPDPGPSALSSSPCHLPTVDIPDNHGEQDYRGIDDEGESSPEVNLSAPLPPGVKEAEIPDKKLTCSKYIWLNIIKNLTLNAFQPCITLWV